MTAEKTHRPLTQEEQKALLRAARVAIEKLLGERKTEPAELDSPIFSEKRGAFVTLHNRGELRGCIGYVQAYKPLHETVCEMAVAACRDPRFKPVDAHELSDIDIEISVLSLLRQIADINEIEVGQHGLYIKNGAYSGLLLPQVATDYNWDAETFLRQTCRKAALPLEAWRYEDTIIKIFTAQVFGEK
ncbi:AmmeMemoRadiSam system protein A [candidate division KSB1 bacterium]|nr:AmmeMemoRadiSam system protein A [candidate division KSB1 bacterium]RQW02510.1 MAG: AmmeMemoRadiSam system protein A [candidate division KSB1 bacterium]